MGREIRRVVPNWEHPKDYRGKFKPLYDEGAEEAWEGWLKDFEKFKQNKKELCEEYGMDDTLTYRSFCMYNVMPPDPDYYRPDWNPDEMTWYQLYETVSEGTPLSPPFETKEELAQYLAENGDFWGKSWALERATKFVDAGYAPSMVFVGGELKTGVEYVTEAK